MNGINVKTDQRKNLRNSRFLILKLNKDKRMEFAPIKIAYEHLNNFICYFVYMEYLIIRFYYLLPTSFFLLVY